jgi:hypothetical protein
MSVTSAQNPLVAYWVDVFQAVADEWSVHVQTSVLRAFAKEVLDKSAPITSSNTRTNDPETSQEAGRKHKSRDLRVFRRGTQKDRLLRQLLKGSSTAQGAAEAVSIEYTSTIESCRRRVGELAQVGYVRDTGERWCNPGSTSPATVYEITDLGRAVLVRIDQTGKSFP